MAILNLHNVTKYFGGLAAITNLDLHLNKGELLGLIGPNGSGKSTIFNIISGVLPVTRGNIIFKGKNITKHKPHQITQSGISRKFQLTTIFDTLTVLQNVMIGGFIRAGFGIGFLEAFIPNQKKESELKQRAMEVIDIVGLADFKDELGENLPHGRRQALAIAMALGGEPEVLLLDEPVSGMSAEETTWMMELVTSLRKDGKRSILLVEHNMSAVMNYCDRIVVLNFGKKIAEGLPNEIRDNGEVIKAYLGAKHHVA